MDGVIRYFAFLWFLDVAYEMLRFGLFVILGLVVIVSFLSLMVVGSGLGCVGFWVLVGFLGDWFIVLCRYFGLLRCFWWFWSMVVGCGVFGCFLAVLVS